MLRRIVMGEGLRSLDGAQPLTQYDSLKQRLALSRKGRRHNRKH